MDLAPDWLSVLNFILVAFLGWKTLGPRRKTKISIFLDRDTAFEFDGKSGYRRLIVLNHGHFPAHGLTLELTPSSSSLGRQMYQSGDLAPWESDHSELALRNFEKAKVLATYRDSDNKLTRVRLKLTLGTAVSESANNKPITGWIDREGSSGWRPDGLN